ncbi:MAG: HEAT repeat domain-containing protein [Blastocatellia bacterium]
MERSGVRSAAAMALSQIPEADPTLANQMLNPLLAALKDSDPDVRGRTTSALREVAKADPEGSLNPLLAAIKDSDPHVRSAAAKALEKVIQA